MLDTSLEISTRSLKYKSSIDELLSLADIKINGGRPWDIYVHNDLFYERVIKGQSIGLGESYIEGWWDCNQLDSFFDRIFFHKIDRKLKVNWPNFFRLFVDSLFKLEENFKIKKLFEKTYILGNDFYNYMLGETMSHTCAYWKEANTLDEAQLNKYELICRKLNLKDTDIVLELGCGWGGFSRFASTQYGCQIVAVNIVAEQIKYAKKFCDNLPVQLYLCNYEDINIYNKSNKKFDKIISIGLNEGINHKSFIRMVDQQLKNNGLFLLHTIGNNKTIAHGDSLINKYIFPHGLPSSIKQIGNAVEDKLVMEDWHNFGSDYDKTLIAWHNNFQYHWPTISHKHELKFYRMWVYNLLSYAGLFRSRRTQLWQIVFSKNGIRGGYTSQR